MSEILTELSNGLAAAVETVGAGVLRVEARKRMPATGIVWAEGVIVTANHVVRRDDQLRVGGSAEETMAAVLVGRDPSTDLAVLRVEGGGYPAAPWADDDSLRVGNLILAVGRPGNSLQSTLGVVSALGSSWRTPAGGTIDRYLQTDVVMYPGFSGGPLVDVQGRVVGMNTSGLLRGVSVALPTSTINRLVETLLAHGRIRRGFLGISGQIVRLPDHLAGELGQETGVLLVSVEPEGPAGQGRLAMGDTIIALNGQPVRHLDDLLSLLTGDLVGQEVPVRVLRGGDMQTFPVTVGERE